MYLFLICLMKKEYKKIIFPQKFFLILKFLEKKVKKMIIVKNF
jgi:hypothetical protein